jgi:ferric-dicitrate binding protein FerR (iron transport regulator)
MSLSHDNTLSRVRGLAMRQLDGSLTPPELAELESILLESGSARCAYVEYFQDTACLRWLCLEELSGAIEPSKAYLPVETSRRRRRFTVVALIASAACLLALVTAGLLTNRGTTPFQSAKAPAASGDHAPAGNSLDANAPPQVATMTGLGAVRWANPMSGARLLSRWSVGDRFQLQEGAIELTFDAGAQVTIFGPADFEITSATSIRCQRGRVTTLVGDRGKGFVVQTPRAKVVDLGTEFGLSISDTGETEVVVFQGSVDMSYAPPSGEADAPPRRLRQGEALLLNNAGEFQRVMSVQRNEFLTLVGGPRRRPPEPVIADVQDNIRPAMGAKAYQIVRNGLEEDAPCFVDRNHQWNGIDRSGLPLFLLGADYVMPFNDDKFVHTLEIKLDLLRPCYLYVFIDNNMKVPDWIRNDFVDTGVDIGLDGSKTEWHQMHSLAVGAGNSIDFPFSVWRRHVKKAGSVTLGSVDAPALGTRSYGFNMYGIAAVAAD